MILVSKYLVPKGYMGITIFPFVILKSHDLKRDPQFLNHERIHLRQQIEMLVIPFFIWYVIEFVMRYWSYRNWPMAYRGISFEREAYAKETSLGYLSERSIWSFIHYI